MKAWRDRRILDLFGIELPIILAPMAGPGNAALAIAVSEAGGLGSLPCAQLSATEIRTALETIRRSHRSGRNRGRPRNRRGTRAGRIGCPDRHRIFVLSRSACASAASRSADERCR